MDLAWKCTAVLVRLDQSLPICSKAVTKADLLGDIQSGRGNRSFYMSPHLIHMSELTLECPFMAKISVST